MSLFDILASNSKQLSILKHDMGIINRHCFSNYSKMSLIHLFSLLYFLVIIIAYTMKKY